MINCQYQRRRRPRDELESGSMPTDDTLKEDPPPEYELGSIFQSSISSKNFSDKFSLLNFVQISTRTVHYGYVL
jgi:hypothetical protein